MNRQDKELITNIILNNLPSIHPWNDTPFEKIMFLWWYTGRKSVSLRLTDDGANAFDMAEIAFYEYPLINTLEDLENIRFNSFTIDLGKKINCPFYLGLKNKFKKSVYIRLYDSRIAMMVSLYGSFQEYYKSLKS